MEPTTFVLFGATGDLAKRKIYPALYNLFLDQKLPHPFSLVGLGRRELSDESFQAHVEQSIRTFSRREAGASEMKRFLDAFRYSVLNVDRKADYEKLRQWIEQREEELRMSPNRMFYLSVAPELFETIAANIQESGLGSAIGWKRLVIEKPFGHDLQSARDLNQHLSKVFEEREIFRIDHYLGKPMVQHLEVLQRANPVLQALLNNRHIANVQITASETVGVEERAGYYDGKPVIGYTSEPGVASVSMNDTGVSWAINAYKTHNGPFYVTELRRVVREDGNSENRTDSLQMQVSSNWAPAILLESTTKSTCTIGCECLRTAHSKTV